METPSTDSEREHLLGQDARSGQSNQSRNDRIGPQIAWGGTVAALFNYLAFAQGLLGLEPMLYVWSILVTISFIGWVTADSDRPKRSSVMALLISFVPFLWASYEMMMAIIQGGPKG